MSADLPAVSVIVAFKKSESCVLDCLQSIFEMNYPPEKLEVIAVDDSTDENLAEQVVSRFPSARLLRNPVPLGCDGSKQAGIDLAGGDIVALTDADCLVCSEWVRLAAKNLESGADAVAGPVRHPKTFLRELVGIADFQDYQGTDHVQTNAFAGCNFAARRRILCSYGYDRRTGMRFGSDRLASWQLHVRGHRIVYDPRMTVEHRPSIGIRSILERRLRYGRKAFALRVHDPTLPGSAITRMGPLAAPAYVGYKTVKDFRSLIRAIRLGIINPWHAPLLAPALVLFRMMDAVGIVKGQLASKTSATETAWESPASGRDPAGMRENPQSTMTDKPVEASYK